MHLKVSQYFVLWNYIDFKNSFICQLFDYMKRLVADSDLFRVVFEPRPLESSVVLWS